MSTETDNALVQEATKILRACLVLLDGGVTVNVLTHHTPKDEEYCRVTRYTVANGVDLTINAHEGQITVEDHHGGVDVPDPAENAVDAVRIALRVMGVKVPGALDRSW